MRQKTCIPQWGWDSSVCVRTIDGTLTGCQRSLTERLFVNSLETRADIVRANIEHRQRFQPPWLTVLRIGFQHDGPQLAKKRRTFDGTMHKITAMIERVNFTTYKINCIQSV